MEAQEAFAKLAGAKTPADETLDPHALLAVDEFARGTYREALKTMAVDARNGVRAWDKPELDAAWADISDCYCAEDFRSVAEPLIGYSEREAFATGGEL